MVVAQWAGVASLAGAVLGVALAGGTRTMRRRLRRVRGRLRGSGRRVWAGVRQRTRRGEGVEFACTVRLAVFWPIVKRWRRWRPGNHYSVKLESDSE